MASDTKGMATNERAIKIIVLLHSCINSFLLYIDLAYCIVIINEARNGLQRVGDVASDNSLMF